MAVHIIIGALAVLAAVVAILNLGFTGHPRSDVRVPDSADAARQRVPDPPDQPDEHPGADCD